MKSKFSIVLKLLIPIGFWCALWQIAATNVSNKFLFPDIPTTLRALLKLLSKDTFYIAVALSICRVALGLLLGMVVGIALAILCNRFKSIYYLLSPIIKVIKSTPVASFIVVLWVIMSGDALSIFIGFLMVMPIIWQNLLDGYDAIDKDLIEVTEVYGFSYSKKLKLLILPTLKKFLLPAVITASGLAWKAEIAAEIIAYTKHSIGQGINDAKYGMDTPTVFAWTLIIIIFSVILEKVAKTVLGGERK